MKRKTTFLFIGFSVGVITSQCFLRPRDQSVHYNLLRIMPLKSLSKMFGGLCSVNIPVSLRETVIGGYANFYSCDMSATPLQSFREYASLSSFFTREVIPDQRPVAEQDIVYPCDGTVLFTGRVNESSSIEVKNTVFRLDSFLGPLPTNLYPNQDGHTSVYCEHKLLAKKDSELFCVIVYLSPKDIHRFTSPVDLRLLSCRHTRGNLLSVRPSLMDKINGLLETQERCILWGEWKHGFFAFCPVGATNVGSIKLSNFPDIATNTKAKTKRVYNDVVLSDPVHVEKGVELGYFNLGSTIVLVFEAPKDFTFRHKAGHRCQMGQAL